VIIFDYEIVDFCHELVRGCVNEYEEFNIPPKKLNHF